MFNLGKPFVSGLVSPHDTAIRRCAPVCLMRESSPLGCGHFPFPAPPEAKPI